MLQFQDFLTEARQNTEKGAAANDEGTFVHLAQWANDNLLAKGKDITLEALLSSIKRAQSSETHPLSFNKAPDSIFAGQTKGSGSDESYQKQLEIAAQSLMAVVEHPDFKKFLKHGFTVRHLGKHYGKVSKLWNDDGITGGSSATSKTDMAFLSNKGHEIFSLSLKQKSGALVFSGANRESAATLRVAINKTIDDIYGGDEKMRAEFMAKVDKIKKLLPSTNNLSKTKKVLDEITETLGEPFLVNFYREALTAESKFTDDESKVTHVLGLSADDPKFQTSGEHMAPCFDPDEDGFAFRFVRRGGYYGVGPRIYATLPKHEGTEMCTLRLSVLDVDKQKRQWITTQRENIDKNDFEAFKSEFDYPISDDQAMHYWKKISLDHEAAKQKGKIRQLPKAPKQKYPRMTMFPDAGETEKKTERKARAEPTEHPLADGNMTPGDPDISFYGKHELAPVKGKAAAPTAAASKKAAAKVAADKPRATSNMANKARGLMRKAVQPTKAKQPGQAPPSRQEIPWEKIQADFEKGTRDFKALGTKYNVNPATISWRSSNYHWGGGAGA